MSDKTSDSKVKIKAINQTSFVVNDVQKVAEGYWNKFGIGPWDIFSVEPSMVSSATYRGKSARYGYKYGICKCGSGELKLIQPTNGESIFSSHIDKYGEGLQHLQYTTGSAEEAKQYVKVLTDSGFPVIMDGNVGNSYFAYLDTSDALGCIWAIGNKTDTASISHSRFPSDPNEKSPALFKVKEITQAGLIINDLSKIMENYWKIFGIGPWAWVHCNSPLAHDAQFKGKAVNFTGKVGFVGVGGVELEPIEPITGESMYKEFLDENGQGLQHLQFIVDNTEETTKILTQIGFPKFFSFGFNEGEAMYFDARKELKTVFEAFYPPKTMPDVLFYPKK
jgi:methylmalonyl-CoA/ethylmalonyl-CoA epimerase